MTYDEMMKLNRGDIIEAETIHHIRQYKVLEKEMKKDDDTSITIQHLADFDNEPMKLNQVWFCGVDGKGNSTRKIKVIN